MRRDDGPGAPAGQVPCWRRWARLTIACALALLAYARAVGFELVWDDPRLVRYVSELAREGLPALLGAEFRLEGSYG